MTSILPRKIRFPVYSPAIKGNEQKYVNECIASTWISSKGAFIDRFEESFAEYIGVEHAASVSNGTVALHLALLSIGVQPGDEVIVPTFTYVASVNAIAYVGAKPVFVDSLTSTLQVDPQDIEKKISPKTKAIMVVHLYGQSCDMKSITSICKKYGLQMIEDCAEAFGTYYYNQHVGTFGDVATFSFFGNKTITTGEGGIVVTNSACRHSLITRLKGQGVAASKQYWHDILGYNYRMTNICAAIGLAQIEKAKEILARKRSIAKWYEEYLSELPLSLHQESENTVHSYWMCSIILHETSLRDPLREYLAEEGVETRPFFYPVHQMPMYKKDEVTDADFPFACYVSCRGINLPSSPLLSQSEVEEISTIIRSFFVNKRALKY